MMLPTHRDKEEFDRKAYEYLKGYENILDAGCGEGRFISIDPDRIKGVDANPASVNVCRKKGYDVIEADIRDLPFEDGSIGAVHCSHVIEHFLPRDVHKILSEIDRVLKKGGTFIIRSPLLYRGFYSDLTHVRPYNPQAVSSYFSESGQKTMEIINPDYTEVKVEWRYDPVHIKNGFISGVVNGFIRNSCPWLRRNGYMLVMRKDE